jgi:hypothetical protein
MFFETKIKKFSSSVEEVTRNMTDLVNLEHLTLYDNPIDKLHSWFNFEEVDQCFFFEFFFYVFKATEM